MQRSRTQSDFQLLGRVLLVKPLAKYLQVDDMLSLLALCSKWQPAIASMCVQLYKQGRAGSVLAKLAEDCWFGVRSKKYSPVELVESEDVKGAAVSVTELADITRRLPRRIAELVAKHATLVLGPNADFRQEAVLYAAKRFVEVANFEQACKVCLELKSREWSDFNWPRECESRRERNSGSSSSSGAQSRADKSPLSVYDFIVAQEMSGPVADAIIEYIESHGVTIKARVLRSQLSCLMGCAWKYPGRLSFLARRVDSEQWASSEFSDLLELAVERLSGEAVKILAKYVAIDTNSSYEPYTLLDKAHRVRSLAYPYYVKDGQRMVSALKSAGARYSLLYALRHVKSRRDADDMMSEIRARPQCLHFFGATAAAAGNKFVLQKLICLGLGERCCSNDLKKYLTSQSEYLTSESEHLTSESEHLTSESEHLTSESEHLTSESEHLTSESEHLTTRSEHLTTRSTALRLGVPLLHLAANSGDDAACKLLIERFGDSRCGDLSSEVYIGLTIPKLAHFLIKPHVDYTPPRKAKRWRSKPAKSEQRSDENVRSSETDQEEENDDDDRESLDGDSRGSDDKVPCDEYS